MNAELNKVNAGFMLAYILVPVVVAVIAAIVLVSPSGEYFMDSRIVMFVFALMIGYVAAFTVVAQIVFSANEKRFKRFCKYNGCDYDYFFYGNTTCVAVDTVRRTMGLLFKFNPTSPYVISLNEVTNAKTNNGASALNFGGTRGVSFSFQVDGKKLKVWTFTANTTCSLKSCDVIEAILKADRMVATINGTVLTDTFNRIENNSEKGVAQRLKECYNNYDL